ncbi:ergothioneine biosynthesis protein EgtB [Sphingomonas morindae]|uniref:Ergothioneine biosynthesis protein EgtB n=1 Tax=Sphingomonas morindae TaxID=1541170 RepID=A0ABY4XBB2_9SPHN|nr:ergothioneine biosynthesis protein EgtB [Sphingomonas morindae]USI74197.1 ergothioneine biosynthesis protein EgtB [Sphingomonas morindae]
MAGGHEARAASADCGQAADPLGLRLQAVRARTMALAAGLSDADASAQSMPDASPAKWHLAHTSWFFETFVLRDHVPGYTPYDPRWAFLFNSYYEAEGARMARPRRGLLTRPSLDEVRAYRAAVDAALDAALPALDEAARALIALGCEHEEQHQELLLTDLLHLFAQNPLAPAAFAAEPRRPSAAPAPLAWVEGRSGAVEIGHDGAGFAFDCEGPRHVQWLVPHALADRPITNGEWRAFVEDGGYRTASLWLADGWAWVQAEGIVAPAYWRQDEAGGWTRRFGLDGLDLMDLAAPVRHISYYEADAFARWAGARLPTEAEWESAAAGLDPTRGTLLDQAGPVRPRPAAAGAGLRQMFGDVWEWTGSAYLPHPGFRPAEGAVGEYNGKFMSGQFVLKGGSCATPRGHVRASYRNFFYPHQRWQFTGVRLAKDL